MDSRPRRPTAARTNAPPARRPSETGRATHGRNSRLHRAGHPRPPRGHLRPDRRRLPPPGHRRLGRGEAGQGRGPERLGLGATFGMSMHLGISYSMVNTVIEFEENRRIAWQATIPGPPGQVRRRPHLALRARAGRGRHPGARELGHLRGPPAVLPQAGQAGRPPPSRTWTRPWPASRS